jgi:asparagine synthase (glutamine-hydrolysing)
VKTVLSGEGADEILGGYLYFHKAPSAPEFHRETVRLLARLHQFDVMRVNKAPMAWGVEVRVPYLDREFLDVAMALDPREKMIDMGTRQDGIHPRMEKYILRKAFDQPDRPWLPESILWRQKEQFSDGVGYDWVDRLRETADRLTWPLWQGRAIRYPEDTPTNPEALWMRSLFEEQFVDGRSAGRSPLATVGQGRSVACSTPEALAWDPAWVNCAGDISGRAIAGVHSAAEDFQLEIKRLSSAA